MTTWRALLIGLALGILAVLALQAWQDHQPLTPATPAPLARELRGEITSVAQCKPVVIYRDQVKQELGLPADVRANAARQVVAATKVPASDRPHTVSAVADLDTGKVDLYLRPDPLPWLALERRTSFGLVYGIDDAGRILLRGSAQLELLQLRHAHLGAAVHVDTTGRALAGVALTFR
jgi:hypothetical protein